jgi:hypothetical protein
MGAMRQSILLGRFESWRAETLRRLETDQDGSERDGLRDPPP